MDQCCVSTVAAILNTAPYIIISVQPSPLKIVLTALLEEQCEKSSRISDCQAQGDQAAFNVVSSSEYTLATSEHANSVIDVPLRSMLIPWSICFFEHMATRTAKEYLPHHEEAEQQGLPYESFGLHM